MSAPSRLMLAVALAAASAILLPAPASGGTYDVHQCDWAAGIPDHDFAWRAWGVPSPIPHPGSSCGELGLAVRNSAPGVEQVYPSGSYGGWFAYAPPATTITSFSGAFGTFASCCTGSVGIYAEAVGRRDGSGALSSYLLQGQLGNDTWYAPSGSQGPVGRAWTASTSGFEAERVGFQLRCGPGFSCLQGTSGDLRLRGRSFRFTLRDGAPPTVGAADGTLVADRWLRGGHTLSFPGFDVGGGVAAVEAELDDGTVLGSPAPCAIVGGEYVRLQPCPGTHAGAWTVDTATLPDGQRTVTLRVRDASGAVATSVHPLRIDNDPPVVRFAPGDPAAPWIVAAEVDDLSGLAGGAIELKRPGAEVWHSIPTTRVGMRLVADLDAAGAAEGSALRARAVDAAGNQTVRDGPGVTLPARARTRPNATRPKATRRKATVTIVATRKLLRGGGRTLFHGRVRGGSIPAQGKLVEVQAHFRGRWRTISAVRSRRDGRWRFPYRFRPTATIARYRLRARVPVEAGYPFAAGTSRPVRVTVHPR